MTDKKFPAALPRRRYWSDQLAKPGACPECGGALQPDYHCSCGSGKKFKKCCGA